MHKPFGVLSQFTSEPNSRWDSLADWVDVPGVYPAGRLDADSEGLLLLTANGRLQQRLTDPRFGHWRTYWVQVEGTPIPSQLEALRQGVVVQKQRTRPARVEPLTTACWQALPEREPPIRTRRSIPTTWLKISLTEGRNRQVRRMTATVGLPTLRLIRHSVDLMDGGPPLSLDNLGSGEWRAVTANEQDRLMALLKRPARHRSTSQP
ncbi:23S rRNA pseudouridine2457 synthase [Synechococcus sp. A18-25c]|uniref:pseudouridine synthase n=1 Tax=Synechococcus sp. A18-25c TaxID=1866938 RepID=UPI000C4A31D2|nr:pseudouridine synthase [Synechococcus sp. A18-25c]MAN20439.1 pseudouridine synthase [Synechococcus sp. EAC657]MEC7248257.1 pseudouridine synthase [Cyanobacteriota bacterium]MEC7896274.1 pseudouridine synthase [Cyanobacteriota bacterium]QNJ20626.1 23S rRNA pseudouridine2457 synthase [Synechococcus sp. A18-25c]